MPSDYVVIERLSPKNNDPLEACIKALDAKKYVGIDANMVGRGRIDPQTGAVAEFPYLEKAGAVTLMNKLKDDTKVKRLDLSGNRITGQKASHAIAEVLRSNETLEELHLANNKFTAKDIGVICSGLKDAKSLKLLNLSGNALDDTSAALIADAMHVNSSVTSLLLNDNQINDKGAKELATVLATESPLTTLGLNFNAIRTGGAKKLLRLMTDNQNIEALGLAGNKIHAEGWKYVAEMMQARQDVREGPTLRLSLDHNRLDGEKVELLKKMATESRVDMLRTNYLGDKATGSASSRMTSFAKRSLKVKRGYERGHYNGGVNM